MGPDFVQIDDNACPHREQLVGIFLETKGRLQKCYLNTVRCLTSSLITDRIAETRLIFTL